MFLKVLQFSSLSQLEPVFSLEGNSILQLCSAYSCLGFFFPKSFTHFLHHTSIQLKKAEHNTPRKGDEDKGRKARRRFLSRLGVRPLLAGCQVALNTA